MIVYIGTTNDANGNPRRGWIVDYGSTDAYFVVEGYEGCATLVRDANLADPDAANARYLPKINVTPAEYAVWLLLVGRDPYVRLVESAERLGADAGNAAGSWYFDFGRRTQSDPSDADVARKVLAGIEDGDPEIMDTLPRSPLSGEWAGDPTPTSMLADIASDADYDGDVSEDWQDDILRAYEDAFIDAAEDEIVREARTYADDNGEDAQ